MAPEIVREETYDEKVDSWSVGVITYILLSGRPPFKGRNKQEIFASIMNNEVSFDHQIWNKVSVEAKDFIRKALIKDMDDRYDTKMLLDHEWIYKFVKDPEIGEAIQLDVCNNLREFRVFQFALNHFLYRIQQSFRVECYHLSLASKPHQRNQKNLSNYS